jgi:hypothetical protein
MLVRQNRTLLQRGCGLTNDAVNHEAFSPPHVSRSCAAFPTTFYTDVLYLWCHQVPRPRRAQFVSISSTSVRKLLSSRLFKMKLFRAAFRPSSLCIA